MYENKTELLEYSVQRELTRDRHVHKHLEIIYVKSGSSVAYTDRNDYLLREGDIFISFPNQIHYYEPIKSGAFMVMIFSAELIYGYGGQLAKSVPESNFIPSALTGNLREIFDRIYRADGEYQQVTISGCINIIMSSILPFMTLKTVSMNSNSAIHSVMDFCSNNFREELTLDSVAAALHLNKYYISHLINKNLNLSFSDYISNLRVNEARGMLKETDMKIADISQDVGFGTIRSFNRAFRSMTGMSPMEYRLRSAALKKSNADN